MRFLLYIAIIAVGFVFFVNNYQNIARDEITKIITQGVVVDPNTGIDNKPIKENIKKELTTKKDNSINEAEKKALIQIQKSINKANETIKEIQTKKEETKLKQETKVRLSQEELYKKAESRIVNFLCYKGNNALVASGIIISPKGHILTNAHVAEEFDKNYECIIRQGSPARTMGYAKLIMFPSVYANPKNRQEQAENDISIWIMSKGTPDNPLPETFPYYEIDPFYFPEINQELATFSYPSELLGYETLLKSLNMLFAETVVTESDINFTLSTSGLSSQGGSSGGALIDIYTNRFAGIIFAVSNEESISKRTLFSLTPNSVERVLKNETGQILAEFLK